MAGPLSVEKMQKKPTTMLLGVILLSKYHGVKMQAQMKVAGIRNKYQFASKELKVNFTNYLTTICKDIMRSP